MNAAMATREQIDDIKALVDNNLEPADIGRHFARLADLDEWGEAKVRSIAADLYEGKTVEPDEHSLAEHSLD